MGDPAVPRPLPHLNGGHIDALAGGWSDRGLWSDVLWRADRFWGASGRDRTVAWHHLVLAVGNFKRQPGRRLHPARLADAPPSATRRDDRAVVPTSSGDLAVDVDDPDSWAVLAGALTGAALPTTSTLLAALWPDTHLVADWRVFTAATGLRVAAGEPDAPDPTSATPVTATFDTYAELRRRVGATAAAHGTEVAAVERSLYELSRTVSSEPGRTWGAYAAELLASLDRRPSQLTAHFPVGVTGSAATVAAVNDNQGGTQMPNETPTWSRRDGVWHASFAGGFTAAVEETPDGDGHTWAVYGPGSAWTYGDTPESCGTEINRAAAQDAAADYAATIAEIVAAETSAPA